jgi:hypothetical protein
MPEAAGASPAIRPAYRAWVAAAVAAQECASMYRPAAATRPSARARSSASFSAAQTISSTMPGEVSRRQGCSRQISWNAGILLAMVGLPEASAHVIAPEADRVEST